jgi:N-acetylmuramoyl-L-alanine amidase
MGVIAHRSRLKVRVDGRFGPQTQSRVRTVQRRARITVDGKVGPETWPVVDRLARGS